jgi:hypothetical protein
MTPNDAVQGSGQSWRFFRAPPLRSLEKRCRSGHVEVCVRNPTHAPFEYIFDALLEIHMLTSKGAQGSCQRETLPPCAPLERDHADPPRRLSAPLEAQQIHTGLPTGWPHASRVKIVGPESKGPTALLSSKYFGAYWPHGEVIPGNNRRKPAF